ncbi:hypothetical protein ILYODFUR_035028, partial [Ilyodon furcidens]
MGNTDSFSLLRKDSGKGGKLDIPEITVIQASLLPADRSAFILPGPEQTAAAAQVNTAGALEGPEEAEQLGSGSQHMFLSTQQETEDKVDGCSSLSGSEDGCSPKGSRKHFIQVMMNSSPEVRRSVVLRRSVCPTSRSDADS